MTPMWPFKGPAEVLDYMINWDKRLDGDTITSSTWSAEGTVIIDGDSSEDTQTTVWLSGGELGDQVLTNIVTTAGGRLMEQSVRLRISAK